MNDLKDLIEPLTLRQDNNVFLKPCLDIVLYWAGTPFERSDGILAFYERSLELIGNDVKYFRTETMTAAKPLKKDTLGLVPFWFKETDSRRDIYMLFLEGGSKPDEPSDRAFALNVAPGIGYIRLMLPLSFASESAAVFADLAIGLGQSLPYDFGQAGLAINFNHLLAKYKQDALQGMYSIGNRYPGIDMAHPFSTKYIVTKGIKCINWLTFLNAGHVERLGGAANLANAGGREVTVHLLPHGAVVQAGPAPAAGDVNRRDALPAYHHAGRLVAPVRSSEHPAFFGPDGFPDKPASNVWLARFDA